MTVISEIIRIDSKGENDIVDITEKTSKAVEETKLKNGIVTVFVPGSTAALTTIEYEQGLKDDFCGMLSRIAPKEVKYEHEKRWHDGNGHSHIRASLVGPSLTIPFKEGNLILGMWQQIVFLEMDIRQRKRDIILQIIGE